MLSYVLMMFMCASSVCYSNPAQDNALDIASQDTRLSLCQGLQTLGNAIAEEAHDIRPSTVTVAVTFDLLGHTEAQAYGY